MYRAFFDKIQFLFTTYLFKRLQRKLKLYRLKKERPQLRRSLIYIFHLILIIATYCGRFIKIKDKTESQSIG